MTFSFKCLSCNTTLDAEDDWIGQTIRCPQCNNTLVIPSHSQKTVDLPIKIHVEPVFLGKKTPNEFIEQQLNEAKAQGIIFNDDFTELIRAPLNISQCAIPQCVRKIGDNAFSSCEQLVSVTIPDSVTSLGNSAFRDCKSLTNVTIPNSVTSIGDSVFYSCGSLTSVTIPYSVISIGKEAFRMCRNLTSVAIPGSVTSIGDFAFNGCESLIKLVFYRFDGLNSVTSIGNEAFGDCKSLTSVTIPDSVTSIGKAVFARCSGLTIVTIPNSVTSIGNHAFVACYSLTSVTIPDSVTSIGDFAFCNCENLPYMMIPNSVISIGNSAFKNCKSLTSVTILNSVTKIGDYAFSGTGVTKPNNLRGHIGKDAFPGHCYIATAIYGSYDCPQVWILRRFRDQRLATTQLGRMFIHVYYAISPTLLRWFGHTAWFKSLCKRPLDRMVNALHASGVSDTPYQDSNW